MMPEKMIRVPSDELLFLVTEALCRHGMTHSNAQPVARSCVAAEQDGSKGHGLFRIKGLISSLASGWVDGTAAPKIEHPPGTCVLRVDAQNGFAQPALELARAPANVIAKERGLCLIAIRDSHHLGALWPDIEGFARDGLVALAFANSISRMVAWGGREPIYGTNPMAFAAPLREGDPLVFDQASSAMAFGEIRLAAQENVDLPPAIGVDREGNVTSSAQKILDGGAVLPFGAHKGSSIAMMVEVLVGALAGGNFSFEVDHSQHLGAETPRTGQLIVLIDPERVCGNFAARMSTLVTRIRESGAQRLPGDRRYHSRAQALRLGIPVEQRMLEYLRALGK